jgi:hypothetical protein
VSVAEEAASTWAVAHDVNRAAYHITKRVHRTAQNLGMKYQNWKHKGAGEGAASTPATTSAPSSGGKQWSSEESTTFYNTQTTYYVHTRREK